MIQRFFFLLQKMYQRIRYAFDEAMFHRTSYNYVSLKIGGSYSEEHSFRSPFPFQRKRQPTMLQILALLDEVRRDDRLKTVLLKISPLSIGWSRLVTLTRALDAIRESGKTIYAHIERGGTLEYALAVHCDHISIPPTATLNLMGLGTEVIFFKDLLDRLDVDMEVLSAGKYKSAMESFTRSDMSESARENMESILDSTFAQLTGQVADGRKLKEKEVRQLIDKGPFLAQEAKKSSLIDDILYLQELTGKIKKEHETAPISSRLFSSAALHRRACRMIEAGEQSIAVLVADGVIMARRSGNMTGQQKMVTVGQMRDAIKSILKNKRIKAVVLRVNSPGGDGFASDLIYQELLRLKKKKPLIVSMGDVAASGGYYLSLAGQKIYSEAGALTGSIGVIAGKVALQRLYQKLGLRKTTIKRGEHADLFSTYTPLSESGKKQLKSQIDFVYKDFVKKVAKSRGLKVPEAQKLAQGRVWTGEQAVANGLADEVGGLEQAIAEARKEAGMPDQATSFVDIYPRPRPWWQVREELKLGKMFGMVAGLLRLEASTIDDIGAYYEVLADQEPCTLLPFIIRIR